MMRVKQTDSLFPVVLLAVGLSILCISYSTWATVNDLRQLVDISLESHPLNIRAGHHWQDIATRTIEHIEHTTGTHQAANSMPALFHSIPADNMKGALPKTQEVITKSNGECFVLPQTDFFGEAVVWGPNNKKNSAEECCQSCLNFKPATSEDASCNVWVWCGDAQRCGDNYKHCWLKHIPWVYASKPKSGPAVPWTSGLLEKPQRIKDTSPKAFGGPERKYHTVTTAQGKVTHWQMRVHYYWFKKQQKKCREQYGENCHMGGFTRLLHAGSDDELSAEIPTYVVNLKEDYVLMSEPDHVFLKPLQNLMVGENPAAFPFFYIEPSRKDYVHITKKFIGADKTRRDCEKIAPIGSSPTFLRVDDLTKIAGPWVNNSIAIFKDPESNKEWGWVMEMYAFTISLYNAGIGPVGLHLELASQPPWDTTMDYDGVPYYILHYTYGMDYTLTGEFTPGKYGAWRFDKRSYVHTPPPRNLPGPPLGMKNDLVRFLINAINEASDKIPGWDKYAETGVAEEFMKYDP